MSPVPTPPPAEPAPSLRPVEELQALCDRATAGPWTTQRWSLGLTICDEDGHCLIDSDDGAVPAFEREADALFIAAARTALPSLLARLRAAEEALVVVEQGPHCCPPCAVHTSGDDGLTLAALSDWIDTAPANASRDPEAATWGRLAKVSEEIGEAREAWFDCLDVANGRLIAAFIGATGQNPRKGVTHDRADVLKELLDVALTALCAVEHMTGNTGRSMGELSEHIRRVAVRANVAAALAEGASR